MKPVTALSGTRVVRGLLLGLLAAGMMMSRPVAAEDAAVPEASRPRVLAAQPQIDVRVLEVPEGGNPLRLKVLARKSDNSDTTTAEALQGARLGVALAKVPDAVRAQCNTDDLPAGFGVMVQEVAKGSPAAKAGLEPFDILVMFDDQKLVSGEQLVALVNAAETKRPVAITLLRQGRRKVVKVRLTPAAGKAATADDAEADGEAEDKAAAGAVIPGLPAIPGLPPQVQDMLKQLPQGSFQVFGFDGSPLQANVSVQGSTIMTTDRGTVTITSGNGERTVTITDPTGKEVFSGPFNNADDWEQIPADYRDMLPKP